MYDHLKVIMFQFIAPILVAILSAIFLNQMYLPQGGMAVSVSETEELINRGVSSSAVKVLYGDESVPNLNLLNIRIANTGKTILREADFVSPFRIILPVGWTLFESKLSQIDPLEEWSPKKQAEYVTYNKGEILFSPKVFNPRQVYEMQLLMFAGENVVAPISTETIRLSYEISGVTFVDLVDHVSTRIERSADAKQKFREGGYGLLYILLIFFTFLWSYLVRSKKETFEIFVGKKFSQPLRFLTQWLLFFVGLCLAISFSLMVHEAYFLF